MVAPAVDRVMNSMPPLGRTSRITWAAFAVSASRSMTPAFAYWFVFCSPLIRATIWMLPDTGWLTYWKASVEPQMSAPLPLTVNVPLEAEADPARPTAPTSWFRHGDGSVDEGGTVADAVVNDQTGPVVEPPLLLAVTRQ